MCREKFVALGYMYEKAAILAQVTEALAFSSRWWSGQLLSRPPP
jgi:hypothetical protein